MRSERIKLTEAEWSIMECLWDGKGCTGREITEQMGEKELLCGTEPGRCPDAGDREFP